MFDLTLRRLEATLRPVVPAPATRHVNSKGQTYWRSGEATALTEEACNREARKGADSWANITQGLARIPWC